MKKSILLFILLLTAAAGIVFANGKGDSVPVEKAVGHINWYGNAPVAYPGLVTIEGQVYSLAVEQGASFSVKDITALQGHLIQVEGHINRQEIGGFQVLKDGIFVVNKFKDLSE